jgi:hypothetical protein
MLAEVSTMLLSEQSCPNVNSAFTALTMYSKALLKFILQSMERDNRIELLRSVWKTEVLPLNESRILFIVTYLMWIIPKNLLNYTVN